MILARVISADRPDALDLAFARLGLPSSARDYLFEKVPQLCLLVTGLSRTEGKFLKDLRDASEAPGREEVPFFVSGDQAKRPGTALLSGRREQFDRLLGAARTVEALSGFASALAAALAGVFEPLPSFEVGGRAFPLGQRTHVMGVVKKLLTENLDKLQKIAEALLEYETLDAEDLNVIVQGGNITRERPPPRMPPPAKPPEKKEKRKILDALEGLPKLEPGKA